ncbi:MAG: hypothetical protein KIT31_11740 [Deltaproteobacteria bacterium]|nr:hypothetical protein [Deltaproteobacteria bacterium]
MWRTSALALIAACSGAAVVARTRPRCPWPARRRGLACLTRKLWSRVVADDGTTTFDFSPDGRELAIASGSPARVSIAGLANGRVRRSYVPEMGETVTAVLWRGDHVLALHDGQSFTLLDAAHLAPVCSVRQYRHTYVPAGPLADPKRFALLRDDDDAMFLDPVSCGFVPQASTPAEVAVRELGVEASAVAVSLDRRYVYIRTEGVRTYDATSGAPVESPPKDVRFAPDQVLRVERDGRHQLVNPATLEPRIRDLVGDPSRISPRGTYLVELDCGDASTSTSCELAIHAVGACR